MNWPPSSRPYSRDGSPRTSFRVLQGMLELRAGSGGAVLHNELAHFNIARALVMDLLEQALDLMESLLKLPMVGAELRCTVH